jgi:NlpC/P60 family putative phage cell wall peptidase
MSADLTRQDLVAAARRWLGTPYQTQQCCLGAGVDCLRLLEAVAKACGLVPATWQPAVYSAQFPLHEREEILSTNLTRCGLFRPVALPAVDVGDVVGFRWPPQVLSHLGLVSSQTPLRMIHAARGRGVVEVGLTGVWATALAMAWTWTALHDGPGDAA